MMTLISYITLIYFFVFKQIIITNVSPFDCIKIFHTKQQHNNFATVFVSFFSYTSKILSSLSQQNCSSNITIDLSIKRHSGYTDLDVQTVDTLLLTSQSESLFRQ